MNLQKVQLNKRTVTPTISPYIRVDDIYINRKSGQYFKSEVDMGNKKVLNAYQPILFSLIDPVTSLECLGHNDILKCSFNSEILDEVLDEVGAISTKYKIFNFDVSLCEFIIEHMNGKCWLEVDKNIIHLQESKPVQKKRVTESKVIHT